MSLTVAFELATLRRLADPAGAVAATRTWSGHVGVVSDRPPYVLTKFTRDHHIRNDVEPASEPATDTLSHFLKHFDTDRFVHVCTETDATPDGWEKLPVEDAAANADWVLTEEPTGDIPESRDERSTRRRDDWP